MLERPPSAVESLLARKGLRQFIKFGIVGFSGLIVNFLVYNLLEHTVPNPGRTLINLNHFSLTISDLNYAIGFLLGGVSNFLLNRRWTFRSDAQAGREGTQFMTVSVLALCVGLIAKQHLEPYLGHGSLATWLCSTIAAIFVNFFLNKYWTFRGR